MMFTKRQVEAIAEALDLQHFTIEVESEQFTAEDVAEMLKKAIKADLIHAVRLRHLQAELLNNSAETKWIN